MKTFCKTILSVVVLMAMFFVLSCNVQKNISCMPQINIEEVAVMDTITVVLEGKIDIPKLQNSILIVCFSSGNKDYSVKVDSLGNFKFMHIAAGYYLVEIQNLTHNNVVTLNKNDKEIFLKSGGIYKALITCNKN